MNKKGDAGMSILLILLILLAIGYGINVSGRECSTSDSCGENKYCGADFKCHEHPVIYKEVVKEDYSKPALIIGISLIACSFILRKKINPPRHEVNFGETLY